MAANVLQLLELLETRLDQKNTELEALRAENSRLKQQLARWEAAPPQVAPAPAVEPAAKATQPPSPHALLKQWYQRYPNAFFKGHTKPLKVGIHHDLAEREPWSGKLVRRALANYVNLPRYIKSMREGVERVDLEGNPAGKVDKEAARHASARRHESQERPAREAVSAPRTNVAQKTPPARKEARQTAPRLEKTEQAKPLSFEDKLKGLQQKFEGR
ncbi:ABC transporter substrate-binding protein [Halomonas sp. 141]|uniref:ProQ/FINO family protein n=1 Tax=Halomonas sp. 141 TaxID=2056666 RepID=UPI000C2B1BA3|nr:ProQ/FINO family protein [Halomonas sp. 141]PJX12635.1 ABC transporter substrate-binding protein [Halomonas sp. 141]